MLAGAAPATDADAGLGAREAIVDPPVAEPTRAPLSDGVVVERTVTPPVPAVIDGAVIFAVVVEPVGDLIETVGVGSGALTVTVGALTVGVEIVGALTVGVGNGTVGALTVGVVSGTVGVVTVTVGVVVVGVVSGSVIEPAGGTSTATTSAHAANSVKTALIAFELRPPAIR